MKRISESVYRFKITLDGPKPRGWRRIEVPGAYTFWDLHVAIQDTMGWEDSHLHEFKVKDPSTKAEITVGIPDGPFGLDLTPGWMLNISDIFSGDNPKALYIYDFGDGWLHNIKLEDVVPKEQGVKYPRCIAGKMACPPEDCGGMGGYLEMLKALADPNHKSYGVALEWLGGDFDPERFIVGEVKFSDPGKRLKDMLG